MQHHPASAPFEDMKLGKAAVTIVKEHPGRLLTGSGPLLTTEKPGEGETPYRSRYFVNPLESTDGHWYKPGESIPLEEAMRQGLLDEGVDSGSPATITEDVVATREARQRLRAEDRQARHAVPFSESCPKCRAKPGFRANMKNHREGCPCPGCLPCKACGGTGRLIERSA